VARLFRTISSWSGVAVAAVGTLALVAWLFDLTALESVLPSLRTMRVNSAVCFLLLGSSIWFFNRADALPHRLRAARTLAVAAIEPLLTAASSDQPERPDVAPARTAPGPAR